jgi:predicted aspartyl protease
MSIGNVEVSNIQAVVQDLGGDPQLSGLLGMNFFKDIELTIRRDKLILRISSNY